MTGYTVHTGASKKFVSGWDKIFAAPTEKKSTGKTNSSAKSTAGKNKKGKKSR